MDQSRCCERRTPQLTEGPSFVLQDYAAPNLDEVAVDREDEILAGLLDLLGNVSGVTAAQPREGGKGAGISYQVRESGPSLVLLSFGQAHSQAGYHLLATQSGLGPTIFALAISVASSVDTSPGTTNRAWWTRYASGLLGPGGS